MLNLGKKVPMLVSGPGRRKGGAQGKTPRQNHEAGHLFEVRLRESGRGRKAPSLLSGCHPAPGTCRGSPGLAVAVPKPGSGRKLENPNVDE